MHRMVTESISFWNVSGLCHAKANRFHFACGSLFGAGLDLVFNCSAVESQKNLRVDILDCWLNVQHGWGLGFLKDTPSGRPWLGALSHLLVPMRVGPRFVIRSGEPNRIRFAIS